MGHQLKFGIVSDNTKPGFASVYFEDDDITTAFWPIIVNYSMTDRQSWPLNVQEHVACLCDERCEEGVILGAIYSDPEPADPNAGPGKFRQLFSDGTYIEYNKATHELTASVNGKVTVTATSDITATSSTNITARATVQASIEAPDIQLKGNVTVLGVIAAGGISAAPISGVPGANGKIFANADIETTGEIKGATVKAGTVSLGSHKHTGGTINPGGLTGDPLPA